MELQQLFCNHEVAKVDKVKNGQQGPRKTKQEDRSSVGPCWHCWTTVPNCSCPPWGLFHEVMRCLYNEATFIHSFHCSITYSPKLFNCIFQVNLKTLSIFCLKHIHNIDFLVLHNLRHESELLGPSPDSIIHYLCGLGEITKHLWSQSLMYNVLIHLLLTLHRPLWRSNKAKYLKLLWYVKVCICGGPQWGLTSKEDQEVLALIKEEHVW